MTTARMVHMCARGADMGAGSRGGGAIAVGREPDGLAAANTGSQQPEPAALPPSRRRSAEDGSAAAIDVEGSTGGLVAGVGQVSGSWAPAGGRWEQSVPLISSAQ